MAHSTHETSAMQECIEACTECHAICVATMTHCLQEGGKHADASHIGTLVDCAQICATSADFMLRSSPHHSATCRACAELCTACAESCEEMLDDPVMRACAETCRRCAEHCREMAA